MEAGKSDVVNGGGALVSGLIHAGCEVVGRVVVMMAAEVDAELCASSTS